MSGVDLSILVVSYNGSSDVSNCLESVREHVRGVAWEFLIRDNASRDVHALRPLRAPDVHLIEGKDNPGFGIANNELASLAQGKYVVCLNPDTILTRDVLTDLVAHLEGHPICGAAGLSLKNPDGTPQCGWAPPTDLWWEFCETHYLQGWYRNRAEAELSRFPPGAAVPVGFVSGACVCMPRDLFLKLGGFHPGFFLNHEDVDLCDRVRSAGREVHYLPHLDLVHAEGTSQRRDWRKFVFHRLQAKWIYIARRYGGWRRFVARALWCEAVLLRLFVGALVLRGSQRTRLSGYLQAGLWAAGHREA